MALPVFGLFKRAPRDLSMWTNYPVKLTEPITLAPKIISFKCTTNFELPQVLTYGQLSLYEAIDEVPKVELSVSYDDGSVRNFTCDNKEWTYETRDHEHCVIIYGDTITYYYPMDSTDENSKLTCSCVFKNVKEMFNGV